MNQNKKFFIRESTMKHFKLKESDLMSSQQTHSNLQIHRDFISNNISKTQNFRNINNTEYLNKLKLKISKNFQNQVQISRINHNKRQTNIDFMNKWDDFRDRRAKAIDDYFKVKKRQYFIKTIYTLWLMVKSLKESFGVI